jgi:hypothetical protein
MLALLPFFQYGLYCQNFMAEFLADPVKFPFQSDIIIVKGKEIGRR